MSADNLILISPSKSHIVVDEWEAHEMMAEEDSEGTLIFTADSLEEAVKKAEDFISENEVEYGIRICFPKEE